MPFPKGHIPYNKGLTGLNPRHREPHTNETRLKCSESQKQRWAKGLYNNRIINYDIMAIKLRDKQRKGNFVKCLVCDKEIYHYPCRIRKYCSKKCNGLGKRNENHPQWNGGHKRRFKGRIEYKTWRLKVFKRDDYTCQYCLIKGCFLHAHHIKSWKNFPRLRYVVSNGLTLCVSCHKEVHRKKR